MKRFTQNLQSIKSFLDKDFTQGVEAEVRSKKLKPKVMRKCEFENCKSYISKGKYCPPHSDDMRRYRNNKYYRKW